MIATVRFSHRRRGSSTSEQKAEIFCLTSVGKTTKRSKEDDVFIRMNQAFRNLCKWCSVVLYRRENMELKRRDRKRWAKMDTKKLRIWMN